MKKKVMFILPSLCGGGAEKTIANLSFTLSKIYDVYIVVFRDTEIKYAFKGKLIPLGNKVNSGFFAKVLFTIKSYFKIKKIKNDNNIDFSISFLTTADFINVLTKNKHTINVISVRNTDSMNHEGSINYFFAKIACKKANHIVSISEQVKQDIVDNFGVNKDKITTIYNPAIKIEFGKDILKFDNHFFENPVFINFGRLTKQKGQWHLIKAFSIIVQKHKNAKLLILGEGELLNELNDLISKLGLKNSVFLLGFVKNPYDYMVKSKCFVFSSLYEGLGNSILESLSCQIPVISTDCIAGPREILAPNTDWKNKVKDKVDYAEYGILTPPFENILDIDKLKILKEEYLLAEAMSQILENNALYEKYKHKCSARCKDFNIDSITKQWDDVLKKCQ